MQIVRPGFRPVFSGVGACVCAEVADFMTKVTRRGSIAFFELDAGFFDTSATKLSDRAGSMLRGFDDLGLSLGRAPRSTRHGEEDVPPDRNPVGEERRSENVHGP